MMIIRAVKQVEYSFIEDFVYEIFKNTTYSDGEVEKSLVRDTGKTILHPTIRFSC